MSKSLTNKLYLNQKQSGLKMSEGIYLNQSINVFNPLLLNRTGPAGRPGGWTGPGLSKDRSVQQPSQTWSTYDSGELG
jgi:hypothetical protein